MGWKTVPRFPDDIANRPDGSGWCESLSQAVFTGGAGYSISNCFLIFSFMVFNYFRYFLNFLKCLKYYVKVFI